MILAGDIGGTKTNLALCEPNGKQIQLIDQRSFRSQAYTYLEDILKEYLGQTRPTLTAACIGVAGPIVNHKVEATNLAWVVDGDAIAELLGLETIGLINDLEANAFGISVLQPEEFVVLNEGDPEGVGNAALISAGTGLGKACLFWDGATHHPSPSEGGHVEFGPRNGIEIKLLEYLLARFDHISVERIISGIGLNNIYQFLKDSGYAQEPDWLAARMAKEDPNVVITSTALSGESELCVKTLDIFVSVYGAEAGNLALTLKSLGGLYIGGGIAPKIINKMKDGTFMRAFKDKGRMSDLMEAIPVKVIMNDKTALLGSANYAVRQTQKQNAR